jgi:hypothetical protein
MSNALNSLAHPAAGLDVAAMLSKAAPCFELDSADLAPPAKLCVKSCRRCAIACELAGPTYELAAGTQ